MTKKSHLYKNNRKNCFGYSVAFFSVIFITWLTVFLGFTVNSAYAKDNPNEQKTLDINKEISDLKNDINAQKKDFEGKLSKQENEIKDQRTEFGNKLYNQTTEIGKYQGITDIIKNNNNFIINIIIAGISILTIIVSIILVVIRSSATLLLESKINAIEAKITQYANTEIKRSNDYARDHVKDAKDDVKEATSKLDKLEVSVDKKFQELNDYARQKVDKTEIELNEAKSKFDELENTVGKNLAEIDDKFKSLNKDLTELIDIRLRLNAISTNYYMASANWRENHIDIAIFHASQLLNLIESLPDDIKDAESSSKAKNILNNKIAYMSEIAYYYAQRYSKNKNSEDCAYALKVLDKLPTFMETLSGEHLVTMVDNYLFIVSKLKDDVDEPHKTRFVELFDRNKVGLRRYLEAAGGAVNSNQMDEYASIYEEIKASQQSI
jgi:hypothetical protein